MADGDGKPRGESRLERRVWIAAYVVVLLFLAAGAARRIWLMF
ncbi:hypothetical protein [Hansschlegelia zhihuaiae]|nr:hypothetical protein [Hansschlegelia zhihuaiae]